MVTVTHRIGGIIFRTESDRPLPRLQNGSFDQFRAQDGATPDVYHYVRRIDLDSLLPEPPATELQRLLKNVYRPQTSESILLRSPVVLGWLRDCQKRSPQDVQVEIHAKHIIGRDFVRRALYFFYSEDYGQEQNAPDMQSQPDLTARPEPRFRVHCIDHDPRLLPPLTQEEQTQLARSIEFSSLDVLDSPLLRASEVRDWLQHGLDRSERIMASTHTDGLLIWNLDRRRLDFFYYLEHGNTPEGRVAVYLPRMFSAFLPQFSALLVHSSGVIRHGRAALFLAQDEGGKTTVLRHATDGLRLNDDQIIVRLEGQNLIAHATPFGRITSGPCQAPLGGLFLLEKAHSFGIEPLKPAQLVQYLWEEHLLYTAVLPKKHKLRAFDLFYTMCHQTPVYKMRFPRDQVDWEAIDAAMAAQRRG